MLYRAFPARPCSSPRQGLRYARKHRPARYSVPGKVLSQRCFLRSSCRKYRCGHTSPGALSEKRCCAPRFRKDFRGRHAPAETQPLRFSPEESSLVDGNAEQVRPSVLPGNTAVPFLHDRQTARPNRAPGKHASGTTRRGTSPPETRTAPACPARPT